VESRTNPASLSFTSSPTLHFTTDFSGGSLSETLADIGHPGSLSTCSLPWLSRIELQAHEPRSTDCRPALDAREAMHEHIVKQEDRAVEKDGFKLLCPRRDRETTVSAKVRLNHCSARVDFFPRIVFPTEHFSVFC